MVVNLMALTGILLIVCGCYTIAPALAFIVGGLFLLFVAIGLR